MLDDPVVVGVEVRDGLGDRSPVGAPPDRLLGHRSPFAIRASGKRSSTGTPRTRKQAHGGVAQVEVLLRNFLFGFYSFAASCFVLAITFGEVPENRVGLGERAVVFEHDGGQVERGAESAQGDSSIRKIDHRELPDWAVVEQHGHR